jgi:aminoglycoside phosphotransferase (APT) family kinase protein
VSRVRDAATEAALGAAGAARHGLHRVGAGAVVQRAQALTPRSRRRTAQARTAADEILAHAGDAPGPPRWMTGTYVPTDGDVAVFATGPAGVPQLAFVKIASAESAARGLAAQRAVLTALHADERLAKWRALVPQVIAGGRYRGLAYLVEERVPGGRLEALLRERTLRESALRHAVAAIAPLHRLDAVRRVPDAALLVRLVDEPVALLTALTDDRPEAATTLRRVGDRLRSALGGVALDIGWVHGDYWPGNILTDPYGHITGIVDWEYARAGDIPAIDLMNLLITARMVIHHREFGAVMAGMLAGDAWSSMEQDALADVGAPIPAIDLAVLTWLRHVSDMITRRPAFSGHALWVRANVDAVVTALGSFEPSGATAPTAPT